MAQRNRDKEFWLIPKRANLHQSAFLVQGILDLDYNGKTWNGSKQDRLGSYLGKKGSTKNGKTITPQSLRTLLASIPQYLGFVFINTNTTPNTLLVTDAGYALVKELEILINQYDYSNLAEAEKNDGIISFSETYLLQFLKLQLTNPVILKDCEGILVFPLIFTLHILKELRYLTYEEVAYFIFRSRSQSEVELVILEIINFRNLNSEIQSKLVETFKKTHLGNISLVQAATTSYYQKLCSYTGLIKKSSIDVGTGANQRKISTLHINEDKESYIDGLLDTHNFIPYDFKNNSKLWFKYIGNIEVLSPPKDISVKNKTLFEQLVVISENQKIIHGTLIFPDEEYIFPVIEKHEYIINVLDKNDGAVIQSYSYEFSDINCIEIENVNSKNINYLEENDLEIEIINHINSSSFSPEYLQYISIVEKLIDRNLQSNKNLRGGRLEYLFYQYFLKYENKGIIDEVYWNGKVGSFGLASPSPGGPSGQPDLLLFIEDIIVVVELTTIRPKSMQWSAEGASVPDHIRLIEERFPDHQIYAFYLAPQIHHERVTKGMLSRLQDYKSKLHCLEIDSFLNEGAKFKNKEDFIKFLNS